MINKNISEVIHRININREIDSDLLSKAFYNILQLEDQSIRDVLLGTFLTGLMVRKPNIEEIKTLLNCSFLIDGFTRADTEMHTTGKFVIEYMGSGKKGIKTINISTPSAIVAAASGATILKKGSYATSSVNGSADFMSLIGAKPLSSVSEINRALKVIDFAFVNIQNFIPRFDLLYTGKFFAPHVLSFGLPAIITPVKGDFVLYGLSHPDITLSANVLREFGIKEGMVVSSTNDGIHYLDEMGIYGSTQTIQIKKGEVCSIQNFNPNSELMLSAYTSQDIAERKIVSENISCAVRALKGSGKGAHMAIICLNAAKMLCLSGIVQSMKEGYHVARKSIENGSAFRKIEAYIEFTGGNLNKLKEYL